MKSKRNKIVKRDWKIIIEILRSIEQCRLFNTDSSSNDKDLIAYNFDLLLNDNYITCTGGCLSQSRAVEELDYIVDFIEEKAELTFNGHELLDCLNSKAFLQVKEELSKMGIDGSLKTVQKITSKLLAKQLKQKLKL